MNKLKFIPVLAVAALLSACGGNSISVKAPKFAKEGKEVSAEAFVTEATKALEALDISKEEPISSKVLTTKSSSETGVVQTRGKKVVSEQKNLRSQEIKYELDMTKWVGRAKGIDKQQTIKKNGSSKSESYQEEKEEVYLQTLEYEDKLYGASVSVTQKTVDVLVELTGELTTQIFIENMGRNIIENTTALGYFESILITASTWGDEIPEEYKLYQNGNTFTFTVDAEETQDYKTDDEVIYKMTFAEHEKCQYVLDGTTIKYAYSSEYSIKAEFLKDVAMDPSTLMKAGDVFENYSHDYAEAESKNAKVNIGVVKTDDYNILFR